MTLSTVDTSLEEIEPIERLTERLDEPEWLGALRRRAWAEYSATPWPDRSDERWRRTDLKRLDRDRIRPPHGSETSPRLQVRTGSVDRESAIEQGRLHESLTRRGLLFGPWSAVARENRDRLERAIALTVEGADKFEWLARAYGADGYAVHVPRGVEVESPLWAFVDLGESRSRDDAGLAAAAISSADHACVYPRSVIVAEPGSRVTVVEAFGAGGDVSPYLHAGLTEVFVGEGAEVTIVSLQDWGAETWTFHTQRSHVERDGRIVTLSVHLGSGTVKANVIGGLTGERAESRMLGVVFGGGRQHFDLYTLQDHQANATRSDLLFKSALRDESKSIYSGLIRVDEHVVGADAYQSNRNLMLSEHSKADSQPMIEILNNEVRCTHGASMGPIDVDQLFFLMSRGLTKSEAERMVVQGFFEETLDPVRDESVRTWLHNRVAAGVGADDAEAVLTL